MFLLHYCKLVFSGRLMRNIQLIAICITFLLHNTFLFAEMEQQLAIPCVSYAQESLDSVLDDQLINQLLSTSPKLAKLVNRLQNPQRYGALLPRKLLLYGPPGVGKTTIAKGIAKRIGRPYKFLRASLLVNEYKNSGPQNLAREIVPILQSNQPYVIIVDEIHALTQNHKKEHNADPGTAEALWSILDECAKSPYILFIGTTNDVTELPDPLKSRFANGTVEIPLPTVKQRQDILKFYLRNVFYNLSERELISFAKQTSNFSGRFLEQLAQDSLLYALDRNENMIVVGAKDIERALRIIKKNQRALALSGWGKYKQYLKDNANILGAIISSAGVIVGLGFQYWSMQQQKALLEKSHKEQIELTKKQNKEQKKLEEEKALELKNIQEKHHTDQMELTKQNNKDQLEMQQKNADASYDVQLKSAISSGSLQTVGLVAGYVGGKAIATGVVGSTAAVATATGSATAVTSTTAALSAMAALDATSKAAVMSSLTANPAATAAMLKGLMASKTLEVLGTTGGIAAVKTAAVTGGAVTAKIGGGAVAAKAAAGGTAVILGVPVIPVAVGAIVAGGIMGGSYVLYNRYIAPSPELQQPKVMVATVPVTQVNVA